MIVGIGIDLVEIERIEKIYARFGSNFLKKIFSANELALNINPDSSFLAGRFAAKEAAVKALGTGFSQGIGPRQIEILQNASGSPYLNLLGRAKDKAHALGVRSALLSISHERGHAVALVVMEQ